MGRLYVMGRKLTTKDVIQGIIEVHGDKYDLSRLVYVNRRTKVEVIPLVSDLENNILV